MLCIRNSGSKPDTSALNEAVKRGQTDVVKKLLDAGAKPDTSALNEAVKRGQTDVVKKLLDAGAKPDTSALNEAVKRGQTDVVKRLLDAGAKPDTSALNEAVKNGWTEVVKMLLGAGAKWMKSAEFEKPLAMALHNWDCPPDLIEMLLKQGEDPNDHDGQLGNIPLMNAIGQEWCYQDYKGDPINVQLLLEYGANPNVAHRVAIGGSGETKWEYRTALHEAIQLGHAEVVKLLLAAGANYNESGALENPMMLALQKGKGHPDLIKLLLQHGADPNYHETDEDSLLIHAVTNLDYLETVELLLEHGADPNVACRLNKGGPGEAKWVKQTALCEAVRLQWTEGVKLLLDAGAKCTGVDVSQNLIALALHEYSCPIDLIQLLLEHGVDLNDHDNQLENIPLLKAISNSICYQDDQIDTPLVQLFLKHGANPNVAHRVDIGRPGETKWVQRTALHEAAAAGCTERVKMLLDAGAICMKSVESQNLLALALHHDHCSTELIKLLLENGADPNDHDDQPRNIPLLTTLLHHRYKTNYRIILNLLLEHGANPNASYTRVTGTSSQEIHRTALYEAAGQGYSDVVKTLLDAGGKLKIGALENPLSLALHNRDCSPDVIELLLKHGVDPNDHDGQLENTPLLNAIEGRFDQDHQVQAIFVRLLLEHGANPNVAHRVKIRAHGQTKWVHRTALHEAARTGWTEGVKILVDAGAKCTMSDALQNLLVLALQDRNCHPDLIELLLKHGANPNHHEKDEDIPLSCAIHNTSNIAHLSKIVQLLLKHGANPNVLYMIDKGGYEDAKWEHRTPVHEAAARGWTEGVKMLLDADAKCMKSKKTLALALHHGDCSPDLIKLLLENGADPNDHDDQLGNIPLMNAIGHEWYHQDCRNDPIIVQLLLAHGANPNVSHKVYIGEDGEKWGQRTALHFAARKGSTEVVKMLLDSGAKCVTSDELKNPLAFSLLNHCSPDLIDLLLKHGADPNDHDERSGNIPLINAIRYGRYNPNRETIVKQLLEHGANPNVAYQVQMSDDDNGYDNDDDDRPFEPNAKWEQRTPLHEAARLGWTEGVKMLLDAGAKCTTSDGLQNPLAMELKTCDCSPDVIDLLLKHGADPNDHDERSGNIPLINAIRYGRCNQNGETIVKKLLEHGANPNVAHQVQINDNDDEDVDDDDDLKPFDPDAKWVQQTPLHEAARLGWTEVVKMLLDAGAKCTTSDGLQNPLAMALQKSDCSPDLIELLLKHGADPNDHDERSGNIPLLNAIRNERSEHNGDWFATLRQDQKGKIIVKHLLEHGANPNVAHQVKIHNNTDAEAKWVQLPALHEAAQAGWTEGVKMLLDAGAKCMKGPALKNPLLLALRNVDDCSPDLIEMLLKHVAEVNHTGPWESLILHCLSRYTFHGHPMFLQRQLDLFFLHRGNINMEDALEYTVSKGGHSNSVRWLIRHGASSLPKFNLLHDHFMPGMSCFPDTPLVLLQAGMRVSHETQTQLSNMEMALQNGLQNHNSERIILFGLQDHNSLMNIYDMWDKLEKAEERAHQGKQRTLKKSPFPENLPRQMVDLQDFSDESLEVYPEDTHIYISPSNDISQQYQKTLNQVQRVLEFLSRPQSLQWYCRRSLRENVVSLQPLVVKTLPGPSRLKRYILCHEI